MNTKPILFSTPMVQAILNGTKVQTRRVVKPQPETSFTWSRHKECESEVDYLCPYGEVGDVLWVRETFVKYPVVGKNGQDFEFEYKADGTPIKFRWKPAIHMLKQACRLFLKIKDIRVERLQDISEEDAISEGVLKDVKLPVENFQTRLLYRDYKGDTSGCADARSSFMTLWKSINGEQSWNENPWVWVIEFERIEKPENF